MDNLIGTPHFEVISRYGYRETLIGRRGTRAEALALLAECKEFAESYPGLTIRRRQF